MRRGLRSSASAVTRKMVSTLAATTCSSTARPAAFLEMVLRRSRRRMMMARSVAAGAVRQTQSPTAGKSADAPGVVPEFAADLGPSVEVTRDAIRASLFFHHARDRGSRRLFRELPREEITPPHALERTHAES